MEYNHRIRATRHPIEAKLRLLMTSGSGMLIGFGKITNISTTGCAIQVNNRNLEPNLRGRIELAIAGESVALPVVSRWVRDEPDGLLIGCTFDGLTNEDRRFLDALLATMTFMGSRPG